MSNYLALTLIGRTGRRWDVAGPNEGAQGVLLLPKPKQFYDTPALTYWIKSGGAQQKYQGFSYKRRDPLFGLVMFGNSPEEAMYVADQVRADLGNPDDTWCFEAVSDWGTRRLEMRLLEAPEPFTAGAWEGKDGYLYEANTLSVSAACEQPHWFADPVTAEWTVGDPPTMEHPGNPGDVPIFPRWTLNAPATEWEIWDGSWGQELDFQRPAGADTNRTYKVTPLLAGEDVRLDTNQDKPFMITHDGGFGPWMRSNGRELIYPVARHTPPTDVPISVTGAPAGATATLVCDRWFSRPVGASL
ncbi:hypothetical protein [Nocardia sp. NPDC051463]|uniref:hypothetical protein n=1 Tax=Nocardia sp. NPDC051463 TaxID=3154845 RepID=UPI00344EAD36